MSQSLSSLFKELPAIEPEAGLEGRVLRAITNKKRRAVRQKLALSYVGLAGSLALFLFAVATAGNIVVQSDFWQLATLLFSDAASVAGIWSEFLWSLLETFPAFTFALILAPLFTLCLSLFFSLSLQKKENFQSITI